VTVEKGEPWERPASGPSQRLVEGDDAALARAAGEVPGARITFRPSDRSDLARVVSLDPTPRVATMELPVDALRIVADGRAGRAANMLAVNMVVLGAAPDRFRRLDRARAVTVTIDGREVYDDRAVTVVVANGQYLRGIDLVPRGHPGDGRFEVQVYAPRRGERRVMRDRVRRGEHLPHPHIKQMVGRRVEILGADRALALEIDGVAEPATRRVVVEMVPEAFSLLA
jgi:hypothetical protein